MPHFIDQMKRSVMLKHTPQRIISVVPSQTELLYDLGLANQIIGITKFCIHPKPFFKATKKIGGTKQLKLADIKALKPDLIIGNKEENEQSQIESLADEFPVWMSDIYTLEDALEMIQLLGEMTNTQEKANQLICQIDNDFKDLKKQYAPNPLKAAYFIWRNPLMIAASGTFINDMLNRAGFENVFNDQTRYPQIDSEQLKSADPEVILLSSEPYPFKNKHFDEFQKICPNAVIKVVDGELFSWYGSRLKHAVRYFVKLRKELSFS